MAGASLLAWGGLAGWGLAACDTERPAPDPPFAELVATYEASTPHTYTACGVAADCGFDTRADEAEQAARDCLFGAWEACDPATATIVTYTEAGDPVPGAFLVTPSDGGCEVVVLADLRADRTRGGDGPNVVATTCAGLSAEGACPALEGTDCGPGPVLPF